MHGEDDPSVPLCGENQAVGGTQGPSQLLVLLDPEIKGNSLFPFEDKASDFTFPDKK